MCRRFTRAAVRVTLPDHVTSHSAECDIRSRCVVSGCSINSCYTTGDAERCPNPDNAC